MTEHGAYRLLMDHYYATEQPLPANAEQLYRICRAIADHERAAVDYVVGEFFERDGGEYKHIRIEEELQKRRSLSSTRAKAAKNKGKKGLQMQSKCRLFAPAIAPANADTVTVTDTVTDTVTGKKVDKPPSAVCRMPHASIPSDWADWAKEDRGWDAPITNDVWAQFKEYWTQGKGKATRREDWLPTWRNWCRKENFKTKGSNHENTGRNAQVTASRFGQSNTSQGPGFGASSGGYDNRDPATRARDEGEAIIARRKAKRDAAAGRDRHAADERSGGPGRTDALALPDLCEPEDVR